MASKTLPASGATTLQWTLGTVPDGSTDIVIPVRTVLGDISFTNNHTLTIGTAGELNIFSATTIANAHSTATIDNFGTLVNSGLLINELGATLNNNSTGTLINNGVISNQLMGSMNNAGFLQNMKTITNSGTWVNYSGATLSNFGLISSTGLLRPWPRAPSTIPARSPAGFTRPWIFTER